MPPQNNPQPQPVVAAPALSPSPSGSRAVIVSGVIVAILIAAGAVAYMYYPQYFSAPQAVPENTLEQQQPTSTDENAIEADLNATGNESSSGDLDNLENSF